MFLYPLKLRGTILFLLLALVACNPNYDTPQDSKSKRQSNRPQSTIPVEEETEEEVTTARQEAEFPGGLQAMQAYISRNIHYPEDARNMGISGKVYVEFVIGKDGKPGHIKIKRGVCASIDNECIRVIENMPGWEPARNNGKTVAQRFVLPVNFKLD